MRAFVESIPDAAFAALHAAMRPRVALLGAHDRLARPKAVVNDVVGAGVGERVTLALVETAHICAVLRNCDGNRREAARVLGVSERTLYRKLDDIAKHGVTLPHGSKR